jgi:hypothetical protein
VTEVVLFNKRQFRLTAPNHEQEHAHEDRSGIVDVFEKIGKEYEVCHGGDGEAFANPIHGEQENACQANNAETGER